MCVTLSTIPFRNIEPRAARVIENGMFLEWDARRYYDSDIT